MTRIRQDHITTAPKYSDDFKEQVVLEVIKKDRTIAAVVESYGLIAQYGLVDQTVGNVAERLWEAKAASCRRR